MLKGNPLHISLLEGYTSELYLIVTNVFPVKELKNVHARYNLNLVSSIFLSCLQQEISSNSKRDL